MVGALAHSVHRLLDALLPVAMLTNFQKYKAAHIAWRRAFRRLARENRRLSRFVAAEATAAKRNDWLFARMKEIDREKCRRWLARINRKRYEPLDAFAEGLTG